MFFSHIHTTLMRKANREERAKLIKEIERNLARRRTYVLYIVHIITTRAERCDRCTTVRGREKKSNKRFFFCREHNEESFERAKKM